MLSRTGGKHTPHSPTTGNCCTTSTVALLVRAANAAASSNRSRSVLVCSGRSTRSAPALVNELRKMDLDPAVVTKLRRDLFDQSLRRIFLRVAAHLEDQILIRNAVLRRDVLNALGEPAVEQREAVNELEL